MQSQATARAKTCEFVADLYDGDHVLAANCFGTCECNADGNGWRGFLEIPSDLPVMRLLKPSLKIVFKSGATGYLSLEDLKIGTTTIRFVGRGDCPI